MKVWCIFVRKISITLTINLSSVSLVSITITIQREGKFKVNVEHVLEKYKVDHPSFQNLSNLDRFTGTNKQDRGWRDIKLI